MQAIGDAISVILMVEAALELLHMDLPAWAALYSDLPSRQLKVRSLPQTLIQASQTTFRVTEELQRKKWGRQVSENVRRRSR